MFVLIGPSGAGKTTLERMLSEDHNLNRIISVTTRDPRVNEKRGVDYDYITKKDFDWLKNSGGLAENIEYCNNFYGIRTKDCKDNSIVVVEPTGFAQLLAKKDLSIVSFFITAPENERARRMLARKDEFDAVTNRIVKDRVTFADIKTDYVVQNFDLSTTKDYIWQIIKYHRIGDC